MDVSFRTGDPDGNCHIDGMNRPYRSDFSKLNLLLFLRYGYQTLEPFVIGLFTDSVFLAPGLDWLTAVATCCVSVKTNSV